MNRLVIVLVLWIAMLYTVLLLFMSVEWIVFMKSFLEVSVRTQISAIQIACGGVLGYLAKHLAGEGS